MTIQRQVEIFSAGCPVCEETVQLAKRVACPSCAVIVRSMSDPNVVEKARLLGISSLPALVVDGHLAACCATGGLNEAFLRDAGVGQPR